MKITLAEYIKRRNGVAIGSPRSLRNNLYRSLGSKNFATFWNYWNPIFGFFLGKFIFKPLKKILPVAMALLITFLFCGILHDTVTSMARGKISFFFTIWFIIMGIAVLATKVFNHDFSKHRWLVRAIINLSIIGVCLFFTIYINKIL
jgi:D-alanyl-lipoteichoic acid acyltransferase DltB (MBOAT superfamily)